MSRSRIGVLQIGDVRQPKDSAPVRQGVPGHPQT